MQPHKRPLDFHNFADKSKDIIPRSVLYTAVSKPKVDFLRETLGKNEIKSELPDIGDDLVSSKTCHDLFTNTKENFLLG